jgi:hypothetical protein
MRHHPEPFIHIAISRDVYDKLSLASLQSGFEKEMWEFAAEAIDQWTRRHVPDALPMPATKGYQWKSVFLPNGTLLRTVFGGKNHHCMVEADQILYQGAAISPSRFVNAVGGMRRNAWRCTWILFPDTLEWKLADTLRPSVTPRRASRPRQQAKPVPSPLPAESEPVAAGAAQQSATANTEQITGLLQQALLPVLYRLCGVGHAPPGTRVL